MVLTKHRVLLKTLLVSGGALLACFAGCSLFRSGDRGLVFNHRIHAEKNIACGGCHSGYETEASAGMPTYETCQTCHESKPDAPPYVVEIYRHAPEDTFPSREKPHDLKLSHALHQTKGVDCTNCHGDAGTSDEISSSHRPSVETCMSCHAEKGVKSECATCHEHYRRDSPPRTHNGEAWRRSHGRNADYGDWGHKESCNLCHTQASCDACHRVEKPQDHTEFFRIRGHGSQAGISRERCTACHKEDFCVRCHSETTPRSHGSASWGGSSSRHCLSCHGDVGSSNCSVCHRATPSHALATAVPAPPHPSSASDCYRCHIRPPHADNGTPCISCHR